MRRDALALVACISLALTGCSLDLEGELVVDAGAGHLPGSSGSTDAASIEDGDIDATRAPEAGASVDASAPEEDNTRNRGVDGAESGSPADGAIADTPEGSSTCDFGGTWGMKITIPVDWVPQGFMSAVIAPGSGIIEQWVKETRVMTGNSASETAVVCGIKLPDFSGTNFAGGETYGVHFPDTLFDAVAPDGGWRSPLAPFTTTGTLSDSSPNATYTTEATAALLGVALSNATTATWPSIITTAVDNDQDGNPGVTIATAAGSDGDGGVYSDVPVDLAKTRANELYVVIRQVTTLSGAASDCDHMSGAVSIPKIPDNASGKYAIDSHIIGCGLTSGGNCVPGQTAFADGTQPVFSPSGTAVFASARVASTTTCASVRQRLP